MEAGRTKINVPRRPILGRLLLAALVLGIAGVVLLFGILTFGWVVVEEFSPDTLERRTSTYVQLPMTDIQIWPAVQDTNTNSLEQYLITNQLVTVAAKPKRWDVVRYANSERKADAYSLCFYFDTPYDLVYAGVMMGGGGNPKWESWSRDNPAMAKVFWPIIIQLARDKQYNLIPELFLICERAANAKTLKTDLDQHLLQKLLWLADMQIIDDQAEQAAKTCSTGITLFPGDKSLLTKRAEAYRQLGKKAEAAKDEKAASSTTADQSAQN